MQSLGGHSSTRSNAIATSMPLLFNDGESGGDTNLAQAFPHGKAKRSRHLQLLVGQNALQGGHARLTAPSQLRLRLALKQSTRGGVVLYYSATPARRRGVGERGQPPGLIQQQPHASIRTLEETGNLPHWRYRTLDASLQHGIGPMHRVKK